ncbi:MAG: DUF2007 domain-containing protein [Gammaproteobacteria bacterium]|nr:DUF2007 domain-containing protein [Gammaproteobacteria bacterium]
MECVYQAASLLDAQLVQDALEGGGIDATINGVYLSGAIGELPADATPSVWVINDSDVTRARTIIKELLDDATSGPGGDWTCADCGEGSSAAFQFCWKCGSAKSI